MPHIILVATEHGRRFKKVDAATFNAIESGNVATVDGVQYANIEFRRVGPILEVKHWEVASKPKKEDNPKQRNRKSE